jgi:uncharacterized protein (TIGR00730 family)
VDPQPNSTRAAASRLKQVCVYCGSSDSVAPFYLDAARDLGDLLARRGLTVVFGGGRTGLMGALADAVLEHGGRVVGVLPEKFNTAELAHAGLSEIHIVSSLHERKARMAEMADAFIALPGGLGTLEELFEILTWAQLGLHQHPVGLLNLAGYYDPLLAMIARAQQEGFLYTEHRLLLVDSPNPEGLLARLEAYQPPDGLERWLRR